MKTVFHIITHLELGGGERVAINIAKNGSPEYEHHIVGVRGSKGEFYEALSKELMDAGVLFHQGPFVGNKLGIVLFPFWFFSLVIKWKPDIIHSHTEVPDLAVVFFYLSGGWLCRKIKYVRTIHNTVLWTRWEGIGNVVEKFFKKKKANVAISSSVQKSYENKYFERPPIIVNGLEHSTSRQFHGIDNSRINILFAGRFEWQKGVDEMVEVFRHYSEDPRFLFHIIGSGSMKQKIEDSFKGQINVVLYETVYSLSSYLGSFDYLFMPSNHEGLALLSIEASFAGTPVIINDCDGLNETLPSDWPLIVKNNNVQAYYELFDRLDEFDRNVLKEKAFEFVKDKFSAKRMCREYESFYVTDGISID